MSLDAKDYVVESDSALATHKVDPADSTKVIPAATGEGTHMLKPTPAASSSGGRRSPRSSKRGGKRSSRRGGSRASKRGGKRSSRRGGSRASRR